MPDYSREQATTLAERLAEKRRFIQAVVGPRQTGKTTLVRQALSTIDLPFHYATADEPTLRGPAWIGGEWEAARELARRNRRRGAVLALDEVQKIPHWSDAVKRHWDEDTADRLPLRVVVLGSAPLLIARGLSESLAGRFETLHVPHWSYTEMSEAFGFDIDRYIYYGGYPGAASLVETPERWRRYIIDSLIETTISRDVLLLTRVDKPVLLRRLFELACRYSGQMLSFTKMLGQLHEAGNATTLSHYLQLLTAAGMVTGLQKYSGSEVHARGSVPKLQVLNTALMTAQSGLGFDEAKANRDFWGRLTESAIGAHLANAATAGACEVFYWRERNREVDFVLRAGRTVVPIEVKSGRTRDVRSGLDAFTETHRAKRVLIVGAEGIRIQAFLSQPALHWASGGA